MSATDLVAHLLGATSTVVDSDSNQLGGMMIRPRDMKEAAFAADMLRMFREKGECGAWRLLRKLSEAGDDGATRAELERMASVAVEQLPERH